MGVQESGNGVGDKHKYRRMDFDAAEDVFLLSSNAQCQEDVFKRRRDVQKFVFACAVFASLNSVLMGYG